MPKITVVHFETIDGEKFMERGGNIHFVNNEYPDGYLVLQAEEIPEFIEWLQDEYKKVVSE